MAGGGAGRRRKSRRGFLLPQRILRLGVLFAGRFVVDRGLAGMPREFAAVGCRLFLASFGGDGYCKFDGGVEKGSKVCPHTCSRDFGERTTDYRATGMRGKRRIASSRRLVVLAVTWIEWNRGGFDAVSAVFRGGGVRVRERDAIRGGRTVSWGRRKEGRAEAGEGWFAGIRRAW